jgi:hypothetical protein
MTDRHDGVPSLPHSSQMAIEMAPVGHEASAARTPGHRDDLVQRGRLGGARTRLGQASVGMGPLAWVGLRSVVLITVSMLVILVGLPAALVAAGN